MKKILNVLLIFQLLSLNAYLCHGQNPSQQNVRPTIILQSSNPLSLSDIVELITPDLDYYWQYGTAYPDYTPLVLHRKITGLPCAPYSLRFVWGYREVASPRTGPEQVSCSEGLQTAYGYMSRRDNLSVTPHKAVGRSVGYGKCGVSLRSANVICTEELNKSAAKWGSMQYPIIIRFALYNFLNHINFDSYGSSIRKIVIFAN